VWREKAMSNRRRFTARQLRTDARYSPDRYIGRDMKAVSGNPDPKQETVGLLA
jgi:hypothetical protein